MENVRSLGLVVLLGLGIAGCATVNGDMPSASVAGDVTPGAWRGVATGREMATAMGEMSEPVQLIIDDGGRYTLIHRQGTGEIRSEGTVVRKSGNHLTLEGRIVKPEMLAGAAVRHDVWRTERGVVGDVDTFFLGHRVQAQLLLQPATDAVTVR
jgi:hypothetical protein